MARRNTPRRRSRIGKNYSCCDTRILASIFCLAPQKELTPCFLLSPLLHSLLSQYAMTFGAVSVATGYALWKKPPNGVAIMIVAGVGGSLLDLGYGWTTACQHEVAEWRRSAD